MYDIILGGCGLKEYAIGIDLGGTKILTALVDDQGRIYERILLSTPIEQSSEYIMDTMAESVTELQQRYPCPPEQIKGVGVACPDRLIMCTRWSMDPLISVG